MSEGNRFVAAVGVGAFSSLALIFVMPWLPAGLIAGGAAIVVWKALDLVRW